MRLRLYALLRGMLLPLRAVTLGYPGELRHSVEAPQSPPLKGVHLQVAITRMLILHIQEDSRVDVGVEDTGVVESSHLNVSLNIYTVNICTH